METYNWLTMNRGFFVGDFEPTAYRTKNVELAIKGITKGTLDAGYYREKDTELICILDGKIESKGGTYKEGDILVIKSGEMVELFAAENSRILIVKFPGTKGDVHSVKWETFDVFDSFYSYYLNRLRMIANIENEITIGNQSISNEDITVLIQGYVSEDTGILVRSVRKYMPGSKILISTWDNCDTRGLEYDELVLTSDPGGIPCEIWDNFARVNNGNRQIVSTQKGLDNIETKYTLKLRSDLVLLGNDFIKYYDSANNKRNINYCLFDRRIIIGELYSRHEFVYHRCGQEYTVPKPFHPSDWYAFGLTSDLKLLYSDIPLIPESEFQYSKLVHPEYINKYKYKYSWRYTTEQHIFLNALRKKFNYINFRDWTDWNDEIIRFSDYVMKNNFVFLDTCRSQILNRNYITACFANNDFCHPEKALYNYNE